MNDIIKTVLVDIIYAAGAGLSALIVWAVKQYLIPWMKVKVEELKIKVGNANFTYIEKFVKRMMTAAEEMFKESGAGKKKSEWVIEQVTGKFPTVDRDYVTAIIKGLMKPLENEGLLNK